MTEAFDAVVGRVHERVTPDDEERAALAAAVAALVERTEAAVADLPVEADVVQVGSTARDTWLAGERDIDLFVCFPPTLDREKLREFGLRVGHAALPESHEEFAEHPYVVGESDGFEVDLVPCYALDDATDIRSAVDRTPFHTRYVADRLTPALTRDIRVCKQFLVAIGAYGSDLRTRGFSGFLSELLVLEYGGFRAFVEAAADWTVPVWLDPEGHGTDSFEEPLVVVDPTDPGRNVAAVVSPANVARLQHFARDLLARPREELFIPPAREPLDRTAVREAFARRTTTPVALRFEAPDVVDDQLWPQLDRTRTGIADELDRRGFDVFRTAALAREDCPTAVLLFELAVAERPAVERHEGPPVHVREHAEQFYDAYADSDADGPFVDGERYVVERERAVTTAAAFLDSDALFEVGLGAHVGEQLRAGYDLLVGEDVATLADQFGEQLAAYLDPDPRGN